MTDVIRQTLPWTLMLIGLTTIISFLVGTALGIVIGWRRGSPWMESSIPLSTFASAIPYFWLGLICVYVFAARLHWFPLSGGYSTGINIGFTGSFIGARCTTAYCPPSLY